MKYIVLLFFFNHSYSQTDTAFVLCGNKTAYLYYAANKLRYKGDFYAIKNHFYKNYPAGTFHRVKNNSGIVRITFYINCFGKTGNYTYETCSFTYQPQPVHDSIVKELLKLTKDLKEWIPAYTDKQETLNSRKYFAFKISNGELTDILPK